MAAERSERAKSQEPRLSASLIVVNQRNEILLVQRNPKSSAFAGVHVFPGGNYDFSQDAGSLEMTAIRESFEETGILLASSSSTGRFPGDAELDEARERIHSQKELFGEFLGRWGLKAEAARLERFTMWTTPANQPRRFKTQFYITFLSNPSASSNAGSTKFTSGDKLDRLPTPDGGQEVVAARFVHISDILREVANRQIMLMPPQYYIVKTLLPLLEGRSTTEEQKAKVERMARGSFGGLDINPMPMKVEAVEEAQKAQQRKGWSCLVYEGDEARGGVKGRRHRSLIKFEKPGVVQEIELQRNFDVYDEDVVKGLIQENEKSKL
ncbi:hypothetical protein BDY19DRAFT_991127 [Irpex rosettiformis]|uniref:Uncharacterized protein n=1 Tax=Irpex rosettiformis TaxID=378272 RepID=A0ACB8UAZ3_9APHY|nr:hypothetical protein BDY19DRAFT_991127 [Irpex rosettiformis]